MPVCIIIVCSRMNQCSHMTVDSATATSQNRFCSCKLSLHKKTILFRIWQNITYLYYFNLLSRDHGATILLYDKFLWFCLPVLWCSLCKIHRYVAVPMKQCRHVHYKKIFLYNKKYAIFTFTFWADMYSIVHVSICRLWEYIHHKKWRICTFLYVDHMEETISQIAFSGNSCQQNLFL
jgi:hypothetical protein